MEYMIEKILFLLEHQNQLLYIIAVLSCMNFGSLLFIHFGRFMKW